jgi:dTDP-N-acetylfucosamine:lipid II N-acetylfucosaminyltransferase
MVTVHVFFDKGGFFSEKAIGFIEEIEPKTHYYYFQSNLDKSNNQINIINNKSLLLDLVNKNKINKVVFHSLHYFQFSLIKELKKTNEKTKIAWVFWSFEYYQLPFNLKALYATNNQKYFFRKFLSVIYDNLKYVKNRVTNSPINLFKQKYFNNLKSVDEFYSFVEDDYEKIFKGNRIQYSYLPYLNIKDLEIGSENVVKKSKIMIGHSGSPLLNHIEVCDLIQRYDITIECLFSLSYGNKKYIQDLKNRLNKSYNFTYKILDKRLPLNEYYQTLNSVSIFFLNAYCQQGLGNVVYFLNNGTSIYFSEKSTTFQFLKKRGFIIFSIEHIKSKNDVRALNSEEAKLNKDLLNKMLNVDLVKSKWKLLLS